MSKPVPTVERVRELLDYDPDSGVFTWKVSTAHRIKVGDVAGYTNPNGYLVIRIDSTLCGAHRLAWLHVTGAWPKDQIDHINGIRTDNRFENLREATRSENAKNKSKHVDNKSGFKGVSFHKQANKWVAQIQVDGAKFRLGYHPTPEEASAMYEGAAALAFGQFKRITTTTTTVFER